MRDCGLICESQFNKLGNVQLFILNLGHFLSPVSSDLDRLGDFLNLLKLTGIMYIPCHSINI